MSDRPSHTVVVRSMDLLGQLFSYLVSARQTFTAEPGKDGSWLVGLLDEGFELLSVIYGPMTETDDTVDDFREKRAGS